MVVKSTTSFQGQLVRAWARLTLTRKKVLIGIVVAWAALNLVYFLTRETSTLEAAWDVPGGGGYCALNDSGVPEAIKHQGSVILPASKGGSYCCGYTFMIAMRIAQERGLLDGKSVAEVRRFQRAWYGVEKGTEVTQCASAVSLLGIGREMAIEDAKAGDFVCFLRGNKIGHSVVLLDWMYDDCGNIIGLHYRSSQPTTGGVGNGFEYFSDTGLGKVDRSTVHIARLNHGSWWRILIPFQ